MNRIKNNVANKNHKIIPENGIVNKNTNKSSKLKKIKIILVIVFILILILAIRTGISISRWQNLAQDMIANTPSTVLDTDGEVIAELGTHKNVKNISLSDMPDNLKNAYISIEDQRFYRHSGVDLPRTGAAILSYISNLGSSSFGGSSITQQLVKNLTGDNSSKVTRKINEWFRAFALEGVLSKDEILETYLNIIYVGPNIYGVEMGANYYFNKSAQDLNLVECAFLAGINNSPNSYNPFDESKDNTEKINSRTKTVLAKMYELEYISESEYNEAIAQVDSGIKFKNGKIETENNSSIYSYHTDALLTEIIEDISEKKHISEDFATNYINMAGLKIYSTQNSKIQDEIEDEFSKKRYILKSQNDSSATSQAAMVIIEQETGYVVGCVGGLGEKTTSRGFNRATQALRQTGSAGKPLAVLAPGLSEKIITPASIYVDEPTTFDDGSDEGYSPTDYNDYRGVITVRQAVESSQNIPFVKMMEQLTPETSIKYMEKMGITTLTDVDNNLNLALGGLDKGISPLEMTAAYACIANDGIYIEPTFYTKIENQVGKTVVKSKQTKKKALSKEVAYILKSLLTEPVVGSQGTAKYCKISGIDVAAKTGTTNEEYDRWLCGFTPYYTASTWFGYDLNETIHFSGKNPAGQIWSNVMKNIHSGLENASFGDPPSGITTVTLCKDSGLLANTGCTNTYTEYFLKNTAPTSYCTTHSGSKINSSSEQNIENNSPTDSTSNNPTQTITQESYTNNTPNISSPSNDSNNMNSDINNPNTNTIDTENTLNTNTSYTPDTNTIKSDSTDNNNSDSQDEHTNIIGSDSDNMYGESTDDNFEQ